MYDALYEILMEGILSLQNAYFSFQGSIMVLHLLTQDILEKEIMDSVISICRWHMVSAL